MLLESLERRALFAAAYGQILQDINPGTGSSLSSGSNPSIAFNGKTYFAAAGYSGGTELYATDGTAAGTGRVADLAYGDDSSHPRDFIVSGGKLFFIADWTGPYGYRLPQAKLFVSDGTTAGTHVVEYDPNTYAPYDLYGTIAEPADGPTLVAYNGKVAFSAHGAHPYYYVDSTDTSLLWVSDGTASGTGYKFVSGASSASNVTDLTVAGSNLFFAIKTPGSYDSIGRYDGSEIQSTIVTTFYGQQSVGDFIAVGSSVYFRTSGDGPYDSLFYKVSASGSISNSVDPYLRLGEWVTVDGRLFASGTYTYDGSVPRQSWLYEIVDSANGLQASLLGNYSQPYASPTNLTVIDHAVYYDAPDFNNGRSILRFDPANDSFTFVGFGYSSLSGVSVDGPAFVKGPDGAIYVNGSTPDDAGLYRLSSKDSYFERYPISTDYGLTLDLRPSTFMAVGTDWYAAGTSSVEGREWRLVQRPLGKIEVHLSEATPGATTAAYALDATSGVTPYLDANNNGVLNAGEPTAVYDGTGYSSSFFFTGLQAGHYALRLSVPAGTQFVAGPGNGSFDLNVYDQPGWAYIPYTLRIRKTLTAYLFNDADGDNVRDTGEAALSGRTVFLDTDQDGVLDTGETGLVTDANGLAAFNVYDGNYPVRQVIPAGWRFTRQAATIVTVRAYANLSVPLGSVPISQYDSNVSGTIFNDTNGNGLQDTGEAAVAGRTVFDDRNNNGLLDTGERSGVSGSTGFYFVATSEPGAHTVRQVLPAGWTQTTPAAGAGYTVDVSANVSFPARHFGSRPTPTDPAGVAIEAETGTFAGGTAKASANSGYTGTGYADFGGQNSSAEWSVSRNDAGQVTIDFRYANGGTTDRPLTLSVNGTVISTLAFGPTGSWTTWKTISIPASLVAGTNTMKLVASAAVGGGNVDSLTVNSNTVPTPPAWLSVPAGAAWSLAGGVLTISSGTITVLSDAGASVAGLSIVVNSGAQIVFNTTQHLGTLTVNGSATMAAGGRLLRVALSLGAGASIDLADNDLIVDSTTTTSAAAVQQWLLGGRSGGTWTGAGLRSSSAAANSRRTLALVRAADYSATFGAAATFHGEAIGSTATMLKYTYAGDATFDGKVDFNDFLALQNHFNAANAGFIGGDFDYSGNTDFNDFLVLQNNFGQAAASKVAAGGTATPTATSSSAIATASFSGIAFNDANKNGKYDKSDSLAAGKTIWLDVDNDGIKDQNEPSTVTDSQGHYAFENLAPGRYRVRRLVPAGYIESTPAASVTLASGQSVGHVFLGSKLK